MPDNDPRRDPPLAGSEVDTLRAFLTFHRDTFARKTAGLDSRQLATALPPSPMTLGRMMKHLAVVESSWFSQIFGGGSLMAPFDTAPWDEDRDWEWHTAADDDPDELRNLWERAVADADRVTDAALAGTDGLDGLSSRTSDSGEPFSLRWILVHMIEEYARHNGHADLIRESIDGSTGE